MYMSVYVWVCTCCVWVSVMCTFVETCDNTNVHVFTVCVHVKSTNCSLKWLNVVIFVLVCVCYNY